MSLATSSALLLSPSSHRQLSPHKKSNRMDLDQVLANLSPHKKSQRMDDASKFEAVRSEKDSFERIQIAVKAEVKRQVDPLADRVVDVEERLDLHENALDAVVDITGKLQESNRRNESRIEGILLKIGRLTQFERNHEQRLSKLEDGASVSGRSTSRRLRRRKRRCCSFCGKDLSADYLRRHQNFHCQQATSNKNDDVLADTPPEATQLS